MKNDDMLFAGLKCVTPRRFPDPRGFFSETYSARDFAKQGIDVPFVQDNHAASTAKGVVRGLHFQIPPRAQAKLVRVTRGAILDVVVDIRRSSPTYGKHQSFELSAENWSQLYVPAGFAHGYCTLTPECEVIYKVSDYYSPEHERGILWNDPGLAIAWPVSKSEVLLSDRDSALPCLAQSETYFE